MRFTFFATCPPGAEPALHAELRELGMARVERQVGGVRFAGDLTAAWRVNLWSRTAVRVLMRLRQLAARDADELYRGVGAIDWSRLVTADGTVAVLAQCRDSALTHSRFVEQRAKDAIVDQLRARFGRRPSVDRDDPDLRVHVHVYRDRATVSADTSGASLHLRGWRRHQGRAPLAETLAAAALLLSGWDRRAPLLDPFCGSGTILVEAALLAAGMPPGAFRRFGFERWPGHDAAAWERSKREAVARRSPPRKLRLLGSDVDPAAVEQARENARAAGVAELVELEVADARALAPRRGWNAYVVANLPFGQRIGDAAGLRSVLRGFGEALRAHAQGYHYALLSGDRALSAALGLAPARRIALLHGGLDTELLLGRVGERAQGGDVSP